MCVYMYVHMHVGIHAIFAYIVKCHISIICFSEFGASMNPCSPIYRGAGPFSEVETRNLRDAIWSIRTDAKLLLNLHTYDQTWLLPYLGLDETPPDYDELVRFLSCTHWMRCRWLGKTT